MKKSKTIIAADLFCGAGGTSTGLGQSCEELGIGLKLIAVNHWDKAIETHRANHPNADHYCTNVDLVNPRELVDIGKLDLLIASPECTHFSTARGGRPFSDQSRATAWCVIRWAEAVLPKAILVENVPAFLTWGPLKQKRIKGKLEWVPDPKRKGDTFISWIKNLESLGYAVQWRKLIAADYGDPTSRERLFIQARRDGKPIRWPEPTHAKVKDREESRLIPRPKLAPYRTAREIIDWSIEGKSIFNRPRPLSQNTLIKIFTGLVKLSGLPFIVPQLSGGAPRSVDSPLQTITTTSRGIGLCKPFIVPLRNHNEPRSVDEPLSTICASGLHHMLCKPFLTRYNGNHKDRRDGDGRNVSIDDPLPTLDTSNRYALVEPFIIPVNHGRGDKRTHSVDAPMPTLTTFDAWALIEPFIIAMEHGGHVRSINEPLNTITTAKGGAHAVVQPYLCKYNGTGRALSVDEPLDTITAKDRFALVIPSLEKDGERYLLDILYRMLVARELAAAMSFPREYVFVGNREQQVRQIGNAVPVNLAKALCSAILSSE